MIFTKRTRHPRFIDIEDGELIEFRQTKESYYLETQQNKQIQTEEVEGNANDILEKENTYSLNDLFKKNTPSDDESSSENDSTIISSKKKLKLCRYIIFLFVLVVMIYFVFSLSHIFWKESNAYLTLHGPNIIETIISDSSTKSDKTNSAEIETDNSYGNSDVEETIKDKTNESTPIQSKNNAILGYFIHTQNGINTYYEESKQLVVDFSTSALTNSSKNEQIDQLLVALEEMKTYNHSYLGTEEQTNVRKFYELNEKRIETLENTLNQVKQLNYRFSAIDLMNQSIQNDQILYQEQLNVFKTFLEEKELNYYEKSNQLYFEFN